MSQSGPARATETPDSKEVLRLWLRLLPCVTLVEGQLRARFRDTFGVTLPQFDVMAELERAGEPQTMTQLSRNLLVSGGNVTGVVDRLERDGYLARRPSDSDRRVQYVALTDKGRREFGTMAAAHERWLAEIFGGLSREEVRRLNELLARTKNLVKRSTGVE